MKSICIKTNNNNSINYLLNELENFGLKNVYFSCKNFTKYTNIIIHYKGDDFELFNTKLSTILSFLVINNYEKNILKKILYSEYFYFDHNEIKLILNNCYNLFEENNEFDFENRQLILFTCFYEYLKYNKNLYLNGFINFRLKAYITILNEFIDTAVNKYIIEKEYTEFISLLKYYISSQYSKIKYVHLVHSYDKFVLLDENQEVIDTSVYLLKNKYISDISFSSNDYILNTLLELVPEKIIVHIETDYNDEFLNTLRLIFENRISFCNDYSILKKFI